MNAAIGTVRQGVQRRDAELFVDLILGLGADQRPTCGFILASFIDGAVEVRRALFSPDVSAGRRLHRHPVRGAERSGALQTRGQDEVRRSL
jgi:hypothetical protein